jgi:hypothetical protein
MQLPAGYQVHPQNPQYMWNPATNDVKPMAAMAPAPAAPPVAQAVGEVAYGTLDVDAAAAEEKDPGVFGSGSKNLIWLDFPPLGKQVGAESFLLVRLLPPWAVGVGRAHVKSARHRVPAELVPNAAPERKFYYRDCFDSKGGPGNCPLDNAFKTLAENPDQYPDAEKYIEEIKPRASVAWQCINLSEPAKHFVQMVNEAGQPVVNADGTPAYRIIPAVLRMGNQLHLDILKFIREKGDPTHPDAGYTMKLSRRRTGTGRFNVEYSAMDMEHGPLHPSLRPVLANLVNLREQLIEFVPREEMEAIAANLLRKFGVGMPQPTMAMPGMGQPMAWVPHPGMPGWEYNAQGQVRQIGANPSALPAVPASPPMPPAAPAPYPPSPGVAAAAGMQMPVLPPMAQPPQPPPMAPGWPAGQVTELSGQLPPMPPAVAQPPPMPAAAPPAPPAGLPPAVAPGGIPAPAAASAAMPPVPPPPPGVPPSIEGPPAPPPLPAAPPAAAAPAMSVEDFEKQEFADGGQQKIPF